MAHTLDTPVPQHIEASTLAEIQLLEGLIRTAQSNLESLTAVRRSLEMTVREVISAGVDASDLRREIASLDASAFKAVEQLAQARAAEPKIQRLRVALHAASDVLTNIANSAVEAARHLEPAMQMQHVKEESRATRTQVLEEVHLQ
jgi:hypothetical protein